MLSPATIPRPKARRPLPATSAVLALALALGACGGGGGDPGDAFPGGGVGTATTVTVRGLAQQASPNTAYEIDAQVPGTVVLTLPPTDRLAAGDTVRVTGVGANDWRIAQSEGQWIDTRALAGNTAPGQAWTPRLPWRVWHWLSSDDSGQVLLGAQAPGGALSVSTDAGATWRPAAVPSGAWVASDLSADGQRMVAVQYFGGMYLSTDRGASWSRITTSALVNNAFGLPFESVTLSADGQRIAAVVGNGRIVASSDGGQSWDSGRSSGVLLDHIAWRGIDSSADGTVVVAVGQEPVVVRSTDAGLGWTPLVVTVNGAPVLENWYRVAVSGDGRTLALAANASGGSSGRGIYVSRDGGDTWRRALALDGNYTALSVSHDGQVIGATLTAADGNASRALLSTDGGASFAAVTPVANDNWRAIALSADGNRIATAAGNFLAGTAGPLYTSAGNRTAIGAAGAITGGQGEGVLLRHEGGGRFTVQSSTGTFVIR